MKTGGVVTGVVVTGAGGMELAGAGGDELSEVSVVEEELFVKDDTKVGVGGKQR